MITFEKIVSTWQFPVNKVIKFGPCWEAAPTLIVIGHVLTVDVIGLVRKLVGGIIIKTPALIAGAPFPFPFFPFSPPTPFPFCTCHAGYQKPSAGFLEHTLGISGFSLHVAIWWQWRYIVTQSQHLIHTTSRGSKSTKYPHSGCFFDWLSTIKETFWTGHYKDLTVTGNPAWIVSGTQGIKNNTLLKCLCMRFSTEWFV